MKREITCYETNNLDTFKFINWCKTYLNAYTQRKLMLLHDIAKEIWRMIQQDVFNVLKSEISFNELINAVGYSKFYMAMFDMCYVIDQKEEDYIYYRNFEDIDSISLIGKPIYEFLNKIEEMLPYED